MSTEVVPLHEWVSGEMLRAILRMSTNELLAIVGQVFLKNWQGMRPNY